MKYLSQTTITLVLLISQAKLYGDSFLPSSPEAFTSPNGSYIVRIEASQKVKNAKFLWEFTTFRVFKYNKDSSLYVFVGKFDVKGHPLEVLINDAGSHIVTVDQKYAGRGYGQIAALYTLQGKQLKEWSLKNLFKVDSVFDEEGLPKFRRTASSIIWRSDVGWSYDQRSVWVGAPTTFELKEDGSFTIRHGKEFDSYLIGLDKVEMKRVPQKK